MLFGLSNDVHAFDGWCVWLLCGESVLGHPGVELLIQLHDIALFFGACTKSIIAVLKT